MSPLLLGAALGATGAFIFDPEQGPRRRALVRGRVNNVRKLAAAARGSRRTRVEGIAGAASVLYAVARGGIGALVPLAVGAALLACAVNGSPRRSAQ